MDEEDFDSFYAGSYQRLVGQVYAMVGNWDEAQECVQEAFVRAWSHRRQLNRGDSPAAWVRTTAYRLAVSRWRRAIRARRPPDRALQQQRAPVEPNADHVALVAALKQLPEPQRRALVLFHVCDLPIPAVASEVGASEGTIKARLSRGRAGLRAFLDDESTTGLAEGSSHV